MMYAFFTENNNTDQLWSDNGNITFREFVINSLPIPPYYPIADTDGVIDLCKDIDPQLVSQGYNMQFRRTDGSFYTCYPQIFIGDHPIHRPK